ncbi:sulfotransferase, partial [Shewanella algae]|uniref:sulfotransferase n=1 Tax=Shewanella algae TaxID=38313 RepID=UPI00313CB9BA
VFVDKAPLSTLWLPMIAKLFPTAKVLLAIRDPRDVVISAFRHRFFVNALAWPFTDLVDAAEFYAGVMGLGVLYQEKLSLDLYTHRH